MTNEQRRVLVPSPPTYESPLEKLQGLVTPTSLFFVRNHHPTPEVRLDTWRLRVEGRAVRQPVELTYDEIVNMPSRVQLTLLECAGNGRSFYEKFQNQPAKGVQWTLGGVSLGEWTGVPLAEILEKAGVKDGAVDVLLEGLDEPRVSRPIPLPVALNPGTILAYALNGESLPVENGFPLRAVVPGWAGIAHIKWLGRIAVEDRPVQTKYNTEDYVLKGDNHPGSPPLTFYGVKSAVALPWGATIGAGRRMVSGFAWSGLGAIERVEYSVDAGKTWANARLLNPAIPHAWTRWEFPWEASPGSRTILTRATDDQGNTQPDRMPPNELGYLYNAVVPHPVNVV